MHELFITAVIPDHGLKRALMVLQGLCGMTPAHRFERFLTFEGPKSNPLTPLPAAVLQNKQQQNWPLWLELNQQLTRQSYYVSICHEIHMKNFPPAAGDAAELSEHELSPNAPGTLYFIDFPDPPGTKPTNSRLVIHIRDEPNLPELLKNVKYTYTSERIRETYTVCRDSVSLVLSRDLRKLRSRDDQVVNGIKEPPSIFAPFEEYLPFDGENKWILTASVEVADEKQGVHIQRGMEQLQLVRADLEGLYEFKVANRKLLDTRLPEYLQSMRN